MTEKAMRDAIYYFEYLNKPERSYRCVKCQKRYFEHEAIYKEHIDFQSKGGIEIRRRENEA